MLLNLKQTEKISCGRIGVIPYVKRKDGFHFMMGIDARTNDICDFGGRIDKGETNIQAAIRELKEETKQIVDDSELNTMSCSVYDKQNNICILFCKVLKDGFYENAKELFRKSEKTDYGDLQEMADIVWFTKDEMIKNIYGYPTRFWKRVQYAFRNSDDFNEQLFEKL